MYPGSWEKREAAWRKLMSYIPFRKPFNDLEICCFCKLLYFEWSPPWHAGWRLSGEGCRHTVLFCHFVHIISCGPFSWRAPGKQPRSKHVKHVQTCQNMSGYDLTNISKKQKSNMSVDLLKQDQKLLSQISPVSTPHESSLRHDERARNHKLHRHKPFKTNSGSKHWQTMTMCCIFRVCLKRL